MGISFYTFEAMSYTIDVYRRKQSARTSWLDFALYITFFPHLVAGPIMRAPDLIPQFNENHTPNSERMLSGLMLVVWGLCKKVFIADPVGHLVNQVYDGDVTSYSGLALLIATYGFAAQIYCDFSAYSDIAIGSGRILGFRVAKNFAQPYLSLTIRDFWRRWHISLSHWLRDYLYISLGGSRGSRVRTYLNLILTMLLGGLWHGAGWTFAIWGLLHGLYLAIERFFGVEQLDADAHIAKRLLRGALTFHLVCLAWVFFRAHDAGQAFSIIARIASAAPGQSLSPLPALVLLGVIVFQLIRRKVNFGEISVSRPLVSRYVAYVCLALIAIAIAGGKPPEFIYFQF